MPQPAHLNPLAFEAAGGQVGVLLIHGFTGSVAETRPMGVYLAERGLTVRCPLLPGHGTRPEDLTRVSWQEWAGEVDSALGDLQRLCDTVFVGGLSLGSLLTLWLGSEYPDIAGLIAMAPAINVTKNRLMPLALVFRYLLKYYPFGTMGDGDLSDPRAVERSWHYDEIPLWGASEIYLLQRKVRLALPRVQQPILIVQGRRDAHLHPRAAEEVYDGVASKDRTLVWLEQSGHNVLIDGERESLWALCYDWMMGLLGGGST
jgi:carboxylesterase